MTDPGHRSGTDRCFEAAQSLNKDYDFVINIQGDEPFIQPQQIQDLASALQPTTQIATQANLIKHAGSLSNPNEVKVIINEHQQAAYFSRSPIPYVRDFEMGQWLQHHNYYRHVGIYAYRWDILQKITSLPASSWEQVEGLEQLRWLQNGFDISVFITEHQSFGIDTPEDLERVIKALKIP
jgi:3-deoxy-manno-octulosonate cytidylyltransferase (CMP-KDO synthetase)